MEQPAPDPKGWTWVLERPCPECGFDASSIVREELGALFRTNAATWRRLLGRGDIVARRPPPGPNGVIWSALEYGAHVRDVYELFLGRLDAMLADDDPVFEDWDQDRAAIDGRYAELEPDRVAYGLAVVAGKVADAADRVHGETWNRAGFRADGAVFTVQSLLTYLLHDVTHHVADVEAGYEALAEA